MRMWAARRSSKTFLLRTDSFFFFLFRTTTGGSGVIGSGMRTGVMEAAAISRLSRCDSFFFGVSTRSKRAKDSEDGLGLDGACATGGAGVGTVAGSEGVSADVFWVTELAEDCALEIAPTTGRGGSGGKSLTICEPCDGRSCSIGRTMLRLFSVLSFVEEEDLGLDIVASLFEACFRTWFVFFPSD